jgi:hypothetical protein
MNDIQLLSEVGQALYGENWQSTLSADIAVSDRSMRRWANGTDQIPWGVWLDVYRRLEARALTVDYWKNALYERVVLRECEQRPVGKFDPETDWLIEAHEPLDGRHSQKDFAVLRSLANIRAFMKRHPGVRVRETLSSSATLDLASFKSSANGGLGRHDRHDRAGMRLVTAASG